MMIVQLEIICRTSGIWPLRRDLRISWVRSVWGLQRVGSGRTEGGVLNRMVVTLDLAFLSLVDILLVVGDDSLGEGLPDGVDLGHVASSPHANADVEVLEAF